jgi:hypothetical protein
MWLRPLAFVPMVLVAHIRRIERRTIARLQDAGANTAELAILLEQRGPVERWVHRRLERAEALKPAANDRYYLYAPAYEAFQRSRRRRALIVLAVLVAALVALYLLGAFS